MKMIVVVAMLMVTSNAFAYVSGIAIQTEKLSPMQVYVNGKLHNKQPGNFVRIKGLPGLFHLEVKVLNPYDKRWYVVRQSVTTKSGVEQYFKLVFRKGAKPQMQEIKKYPVYTRYFLNPGLYNRNPIS